MALIGHANRVTYWQLKLGLTPPRVGGTTG